METFQWYDFLRIITAFLSLYSLLMLSRRAFKFWANYTSYLKDIWLVLVGFQVLLVESSIESITLGVHGGPRTVISLVLAVICVRVTASNDATFLESWDVAKKFTKPDRPTVTKE